jgi:hypothetical protein
VNSNALPLFKKKTSHQQQPAGSRSPLLAHDDDVASLGTSRGQSLSNADTPAVGAGRRPRHQSFPGRPTSWQVASPSLHRIKLIGTRICWLITKSSAYERKCYPKLCKGRTKWEQVWTITDLKFAFSSSLTQHAPYIFLHPSSETMRGGFIILYNFQQWHSSNYYLI